MSNLINSDGHPTIIQVCEGKQPHKIDNNKENKLKIPGLFDRGGETGDLKVMHSNGETTTYYNYDGSFAVTAIKIWADGTDMDHSKIKLVR